MFIDGYNDFMYYDKEIYGEDRLRGLLSGQIQSKQKKFTDHLPIVKVAKKILQKIKFKQKTQNPEGEEKYPHRYLPVSKEPDAKLSFVIDRYLRNIKMIESISSEFGIETTFVWQPCPMYNFDVKRHLFFDGGWGNFSQNKRGYTRFKELQKSGQLPLKNIVFGGDWHPTSGPPLYIDNLHYSAGFSDVIAEKIVESMVWE